MQDRTWTSHRVGNHDRLGAGLGHGVRWLRHAFQRYVETVAPSHAPGEDIHFVRSAQRAISAACAGAFTRQQTGDAR